MPLPRRKYRWEHRRCPEGFVCTGYAGSGDFAYACFYVDGTVWRKSLRPLRFISDHKSICLTLLLNLSRAQAWRWKPSQVKVRTDGSVETPATTPSTTESAMSVRGLYDVYRAYKLSQEAEGAVAQGDARKTKNAFRAYWNGEQDIPVSDTKRIMEHILAKTMALELAEGTKRQYLSRLRTMFEYGVSLDLLQKNPIPPIKRIPLRGHGSKTTEGRNRRGYTAKEYKSLLKAAYAYSRELGLMVELYYLTGMRLSEGISLRLAEAWLKEGKSNAELAELPHVVPGDLLYIQGKGRSGQPRWRVFPLVKPPPEDRSPVAQWQRQTYRVVEALVKEYAPLYDGYLTHWAKRTLQHHLFRIRQEAGLVDTGLDQHSLRHSALTYMTNELRLGKAYLDRTVGNSEQIRSKNYVAPMTADQLRRMIRDSEL